MRVLNLSLMSRWENWFTILLMLLIAVFAVNSLSSVFLKKNGDNSNG